tara:strand:+ start:124344 stop:125213 length:870 start_codon:yes stop_codon:yes gene_type:complete
VKILIKAPAKINSLLRVLIKETSGYHQIETVLSAVNFYDEIQLTPNDSKLSLEVYGAELGPTEDNLVYKAAKMFFARSDVDGGVDIKLSKRIPAQAGLGGGSSDAGATMRALNLMFGVPFSSKELIEMATQLGSDVPFFASGLGTALAWGRGERLIPMKFQSHVVLALTSIPIETAKAYEALRIPRKTNSGPTMPKKINCLGKPNLWSSNHFEPEIFRQFPDLGQLHKAILATGALAARLSGSGGTLFGLFPNQTRARRACDDLAKSWPHVQFHVVKTLNNQPDPSVLV